MATLMWQPACAGRHAAWPIAPAGHAADAAHWPGGAHRQPRLARHRRAAASMPPPRPRWSSLARSWAAEVVTAGVTVNVVSPAATDTPMLVDPARAAVAPKLPPMGRLVKARGGGRAGRLPALARGRRGHGPGHRRLRRRLAAQVDAAMSETVGVIGLGLVGRAIGSRLAAAGFVPIGFDRSEVGTHSLGRPRLRACRQCGGDRRALRTLRCSPCSTRRACST